MKIEIIYYGFAFFFSALLLHILIWRFRRPKNDVALLFAIFLGLPAVLCGGLISVLYLGFLVSLLTMLDLVLVFILHASLSLAYIANYPAATAHSPSLAILLMVGASEQGRLSAEEIQGLYSTRHTIIQRVEDLEVYGMLARKGHSFFLKPAARIIIGVYIIYRKLLGLPPGEG